MVERFCCTIAAPKAQRKTMGMFDYIKVKYPLTQDAELNATLYGLLFQSKDTPAQCVDHYEIREDGSFWYEDYDDLWIDEPDSLLGGYVQRKNCHWIKCDITGSINLYADLSPHNRQWIEFQVTFTDGLIGKIEQVPQDE